MEATEQLRGSLDCACGAGPAAFRRAIEQLASAPGLSFGYRRGRRVVPLGDAEVAAAMLFSESRTRLKGEALFRIEVGLLLGKLGWLTLRPRPNGEERLTLSISLLGDEHSGSEVGKQFARQLLESRALSGLFFERGDSLCGAIHRDAQPGAAHDVTMRPDGDVVWLQGERAAVLAILNRQGPNAAAKEGLAPQVPVARLPVAVQGSHGLPSYLSEARSSPVAPPAVCCSNARSADETLAIPEQGAASPAPALPFSGELSPAEVAALRRPIELRSPETDPGPDETLLIPAPSAAHGAARPGGSAAGPVVLGLDEYAHFCAARSVVGAETPELLARFGIPSTEAASALRAQFNAYFATDRSALSRFALRTQEIAADLRRRR